ncbi:dTDP-glucose 4,6-dehydratase [Gammaproteobacteria bacterium]|nr:dTDP-glucose 4,6-dehydratase [Gammaproteobacteria bacterium]
MKFLVTGGCGFIGSSLVRNLVDKFPESEIHNIDKLTYAANNSLNSMGSQSNYFFYKEDICNYSVLCSLIDSIQPNVIFHLAAESHVDNSIRSPYAFINTNIIGTFNLLEASKKFCSEHESKSFKFIHVSTDEVFGDLPLDEAPFTEISRYQPSSPYSASKAGSDLLVKAWNRTYDLPAIVTNCSNNYGPFQDSEKFIPTIIGALNSQKKIPIYGNGMQVRDWLYVGDHADALIQIAIKGIAGESYNIGGDNEISNLDLVSKIIQIYFNGELDRDELMKHINFIEDRPGHDKRYAINSSKILDDLNWKPSTNADENFKKTIEWFKK